LLKVSVNPPPALTSNVAASGAAERRTGVARVTCAAAAATAAASCAVGKRSVRTAVPKGGSSGQATNAKYGSASAFGVHAASTTCAITKKAKQEGQQPNMNSQLAIEATTSLVSLCMCVL
jgi:Zn-dependent M28 family amino/carboxypeptidase